MQASLQEVPVCTVQQCVSGTALTPDFVCLVYVCHPLAARCVQSKLVRVGFESLLEAQEWHALLAICMGGLDLDSPSLANLPKALAASKKMLSFKEGKAN